MNLPRRPCDDWYPTSEERIAKFRSMTPAEKIQLTSRESGNARKLMMDHFRTRFPIMSQLDLAWHVISRQEWLSEYLTQRPLPLPGLS